MKVKNGRWHCLEYIFEDEERRSVVGPVVVRNGVVRYPQSKLARFSQETGIQLNSMSPSRLIQEATPEEIRLKRRPGARAPVNNNSFH